MTLAREEAWRVRMKALVGLDDLLRSNDEDVW